MLRQITVSVLLAIISCTSAYAVDERDSGIYLIVNIKGEITTKAFRVSLSNTEWVVEDRKPDGSWVSVTCEADCKMMSSGQSDIQRFFTPNTLAEISPDCIHSKVFAFCGYSLKNNPAFRGYLFVALTEAQPIALRLARVVPDKKNP